jgi:hypothetical protein
VRHEHLPPCLCHQISNHNSSPQAFSWYVTVKAQDQDPF